MKKLESIFHVRFRVSQDEFATGITCPLRTVKHLILFENEPWLMYQHRQCDIVRLWRMNGTLNSYFRFMDDPFVDTPWPQLRKYFKSNPTLRKSIKAARQWTQSEMKGKQATLTSLKKFNLKTCKRKRRYLK